MLRFQPEVLASSFLCSPPETEFMCGVRYGRSHIYCHHDLQLSNSIHWRQNLPSLAAFMSFSHKSEGSMCISLVSEHCLWMKLYEENFESLWENSKETRQKSYNLCFSEAWGSCAFVLFSCVVRTSGFTSDYPSTTIPVQMTFLAQVVLMKLLWPCSPPNTLSISCLMPWLKSAMAWGLVLLSYRPHPPRRMQQVEW